MSFVKTKPLPHGVKLVAWARTMRWFGWGFGECLLPLFIFQFAGNFAAAGLFRGTYDIILLLTLPIVGNLADRVPAKYLVIAALCLYPLVGVGYLFSGIIGLAIFIVLARAINGFCWALEDTGVNTYYSRLVDQHSIASCFGYIDSMANFGWIIGALLGLILIPFIPICYLLFAITPATIIAFLIALRIPKDQSPKTGFPQKTSLMISYANAFKECRKWNSHLWLLMLITLLSTLVDALMWFFIPIDAYIDGAQPVFVVLLTIVGTIPSLSGYFMGKNADQYNRYVLIAIGLFALTITMTGLAIFPQYVFKLFASFVLGIILELFKITQKSLVNTLGPVGNYGQRSTTFQSIATLSGLFAPLVLGFTLDTIGFSKIAITIALIAVPLSIFYFFNQKASAIVYAEAEV